MSTVLAFKYALLWIFLEPLRKAVGAKGVIAVFAEGVRHGEYHEADGADYGLQELL